MSMSLRPSLVGLSARKFKSFLSFGVENVKKVAEESCKQWNKALMNGLKLW